MFENYNSIRY